MRLNAPTFLPSSLEFSSFSGDQSGVTEPAIGLGDGVTRDDIEMVKSI